MSELHYVAFLRAINVGGRVVRMDVLKREFTALGFANVETFIASGNVMFSTRGTDRSKLTRRIEERLRGALGYEVAWEVRGFPQGIVKYEMVRKIGAQQPAAP